MVAKSECMMVAAASTSFRVERVFIARLDKLRADILQQLRVCQFCGKLRLPCFLFLLESGDVAREAARVNEFSVFEQNARIDQDMADRSVAMPQPRRVVAQRFAPSQASEDVVDDGLVGVKLGNVPADILFARISEKIELRLVRPKDGAVRAHPVKTDRRGFHEIAQHGLAAAQGVKLA